MADQCCSSKASKWWKIVIVAGLALAVVLVVATKKRPQKSCGLGLGQTIIKEPAPVAAPEAASNDPLTGALKSGKPVLAEFGRSTCTPCKMMKPILDKLAEELKGKVYVLILDTGDYALLAREYDIRVIPTQIFFDGTGKELFRHVGFMPREDMLAKMKKLGMTGK